MNVVTVMVNYNHQGQVRLIYMHLTHIDCHAVCDNCVDSYQAGWTMYVCAHQAWWTMYVCAHQAGWTTGWNAYKLSRTLRIFIWPLTILISLLMMIFYPAPASWIKVVSMLPNPTTHPTQNSPKLDHFFFIFFLF